MQRTLITEQPDGTFQCTVTLTADELPEFLRSVQRQDEVHVPAPAAEKPPAQVVPVKGFEAFGPMQKQMPDHLDPMALASHAPFQRFAESLTPLPEEGDSVQYALKLIAGAKDLADLLAQYRDWHGRRWPGEAAVPGVAR